MSDRHVIAVLFCDLVDSTAILSRIGDVANDELRRDFFTATRQAVAATGGEEVKTQGDGLMATFRTPDDSVAAAIELQRAVSRLDARDRDVRLALRVGVAWGEATSEEDDWFGTPVVEAARLCGVARSGQVLLTEALRSALRHPDRIDLSDEGGLALKGLDGPRRTWSAAWTREEGRQVSAPPPLQLPMGSAFVGRDEELAVLRGCWDAVRAGATRVAVVHGPAGAGATRLVASLADEVRSDALVLYGRALEGGDGQEAFEEALRWFVTGTDRSRLRHVTDGLRPAIDDALPSVGVRLGAPPPSGTSDDGDGEGASAGLGATAALLALLGRLSAAEPILLVIDDAHLLGPVGVELLDGIAGGHEGRSVLVAVLARSETGEDPDPVPGTAFLHGWLGSAGDAVTEVALGPLPADAAFELLGLEPDSEAARAAVEETGLVAARVVALSRQLDEAGHLRGARADDIRRAVARTSPYRGLAVFRAEDRDLFHGRSTLRNLALERLARSPVLVVVGASGSGKS
ncbi:MAG: adenylate/guanylate cyclase domain-containing protein, partial [Acidimicrobiales bacterium]|nr:adenylate/guanylate cyclase domain-containing protein [Acidimicrobiales bacterium]